MRGGFYGGQDRTWTGVSAIVIDTHNSNTLYAAVFRSTDGAASWNAVSAGWMAISVSILKIDSRNPSTVYAGTYGGGIFALTYVPHPSRSRPK